MRTLTSFFCLAVRDFLVIAVATEAAIRCNLYGDYFLTPLQDCLILKDVKTKEVLFKWPYCYVRKFGQDTVSRCHFKFVVNDMVLFFHIFNLYIYIYNGCNILNDDNTSYLLTVTVLNVFGIEGGKTIN